MKHHVTAAICFAIGSLIVAATTVQSLAPRQLHAGDIPECGPYSGALCTVIETCTHWVGDTCIGWSTEYDYVKEEDDCCD